MVTQSQHDWHSKVHIEFTRLRLKIIPTTKLITFTAKAINYLFLAEIDKNVLCLITELKH